MAKSLQNVVMQGASGKIGKTLVFRQLKDGSTIIANRAKPSTSKVTEAQQFLRDRFREAAYYAKIFSKDPIYGPQYKAKAKPGQSAYNVALKDYSCPPEYRDFFAGNYHGEIGDPIIVRAWDDFKVTEVKISIHSPANVLIEEGNAILEENGINWKYVTTVENQTVSGTKIHISIYDLPGNETLKSFTLN